jgi:hypothetical protein
MSIPKKGSRQIEVDGVTYRWMVRRRAPWHSLSFAVERDDVSGSILSVRLPVPRPDPWLIGTNGDKVITPKYVAEIIRFSLTIGWRPESAVTPFQIGPHDIPLPVER